MTNLRIREVIDRGELNEEFYFKSLLKEAYLKGILQQTDIERIERESFELLRKICNKYTSGDSSSIRIERAEGIMESNFYIIGLYLKTINSINRAIKEVKEESIFQLYHRGRVIIENRIKYAKRIYYMVINNRVKIDNYTYNATIIEGIKGFFKIYDSQFEAQEIHITVDYPVCNSIKDLVGIEFIIKYLESIYYENDFCKHFPEDRIILLLQEYNDLIFNIFQQVLTNALGCSLLKIDFRYLNLSNLQVEGLYSIFLDKNQEEIEEMLKIECNNLIKEFSINDINYIKYIEKSLSKISFNIYNGVKIRKLKNVFIEFRYKDEENKIKFSFGKRMDNEHYRKIVDEIIQCRFIEDKISIIKESIKSLGDLEDLILDGELTVEEIEKILKTLDKFEVAALGKRYLNLSEIDEVSEKELNLKRGIQRFLNNLSKEDKIDFQNILKTIILE